MRVFYPYNVSYQGSNDNKSLPEPYRCKNGPVTPVKNAVQSQREQGCEDAHTNPYYELPASKM